ncbi:MAG TPA: hypothetical protein VME92_17250 [Acetobacteraceae bacterium]|nr:hypothetical protein [Acetobacteraceae bacterium]
MADILIRGGDSDTAAHEMRAAVRDIFGFDPLQTTRGSGTAPGTRSGVELAAMIALGLPPAIVAAKDLQAKLAEQWRRLTAKAEAQHRATGATLLIDPGDGKPIPLHEANRQAILDALARVEQHLKT